VPRPGRRSCRRPTPSFRVCSTALSSSGCPACGALWLQFAATNCKVSLQHQHNMAATRVPLGSKRSAQGIQIQACKVLVVQCTCNNQMLRRPYRDMSLCTPPCFINALFYKRPVAGARHNRTGNRLRMYCMIHKHSCLWRLGVKRPAGACLPWPSTALQVRGHGWLR
jgi:hypothetical protein